MIDTGAAVTCFDAQAAQKAGLPQTGEAQMASAGHAGQTVPTLTVGHIMP
ncbi:MAG: aspartyl protease family protein [Rhodobacteraceae bacterium]|nr:aspartyl protease family protein [Paracoccaceae bacterium]